MTQDIVEEQVKTYAKLLKLPSFAKYAEVLRAAEPNAEFGTLLLELMKRRVRTKTGKSKQAKIETSMLSLYEKHRGVGSKQVQRQFVSDLCTGACKLPVYQG